MPSRTMFWITCAHCGLARQTHRPRQRFCSRKCAAQASPWRRECGKRGGIAAGETRRKRALEAVQRHWPGMPHEACLEVLAYGQRSYQAGWRARKRADQRGVAA